MPRLQKTVRGLVLSRRNIGEADRLITLFTYEEGLWRLQARGVRKLASRRGRHLEPLTEITAQITGSDRSAHLAAAETVNYFPALRADADALERVQVLSRGLIALFGEHDAQPALYMLLRQVWERLPAMPQRRRPVIEVAAALEVLAAAGCLPQLMRCRQCGYAGYDRAASLEPASGSLVCAACAPGLPSVWQLSPLALKAARVAARQQDLAGRTSVPETAAAAVTAPWRAYLAWQGGGVSGRAS